MLDTMTLTKAVGAVCGSLLVFMLAGWAADELYTVGDSYYAEGEGLAQAYTIDTGQEEAPEEAVAEVDFATVFAAADAAAGQSVFRQCAACHKMDGTDGVGPHLNGVVGRQKGAATGYTYSEALLAVASEVWTPENLNAFLEDPRGYMPGTKMVYNGLRDIEDRANLIAYMATVP